MKSVRRIPTCATALSKEIRTSTSNPRASQQRFPAWQVTAGQAASRRGEGGADAPCVGVLYRLAGGPGSSPGSSSDSRRRSRAPPVWGPTCAESPWLSTSAVMVRALFTKRPPTRGRFCAIVWRLPYRFPGFWCCCTRRFCRSRVSTAWRASLHCSARSLLQCQLKRIVAGIVYVVMSIGRYVGTSRRQCACRG